MMASELWGEDHASFCELIIKYTELHGQGDPPPDETEFNPDAINYQKLQQSKSKKIPTNSKTTQNPRPQPPPHKPAPPASPDMIEATQSLIDKAGFLTGMEKERLEMNKAITIIGI